MNQQKSSRREGSFKTLEIKLTESTHEVNTSIIRSIIINNELLTGIKQGMPRLNISAMK